ncbi:MAG: carboxylating nicotinate-nucleotide diphosphorylase [Crocinitomicaceae bacterium]|nr:carboxylating nicotinate-nucleotide diphosphorylase [Crocinitomicaceae bacterium]
MIDEIIKTALKEDIGDGDHSSLSCVPRDAKGTAKLIIKADGILAGIELAERIFELYDPSLVVDVKIKDGASVKKGDIAFEVTGPSISILSTERLVLNFMQRMSGIATQTHRLVQLIEGTSAKLLDTRKTTPGIRYMEKWAVRIGGGHNHRFALYDMIMLKDNHVDYAGGIKPAIQRANDYLEMTDKQLKIEIEVRNEDELKQVISVGGVDRIMLDNFSPERIKAVIETIPEQYEVEASGGITEETIRSFAETGVDFISVGALTHSFDSLDMSLKATYH